MSDNEKQMPEYVPDGPIKLPTTEPDKRKMVNKDRSPAKAPVERPSYAPSRNPLDAMHERITTLENELIATNAVHLKHLDTVNAIFTKYDAQIASLQQAVAAIERRQMPLVQGGFTLAGWNCPSCRVFNGEEKERLDVCRCCGAARPA